MKREAKINSAQISSLISLLLIIVVFFSSCSSDDTPPDCGCKSETNYTITESDSLIGEMYYKSENSTYYNNLYWIVFSEGGYSNSASHMIVCNEYFLNNEFDDIKNSGETVEVKFSGDL